MNHKIFVCSIKLCACWCVRPFNFMMLEIHFENAKHAIDVVAENLDFFPSVRLTWRFWSVAILSDFASLFLSFSASVCISADGKREKRCNKGEIANVWWTLAFAMHLISLFNKEDTVKSLVLMAHNVILSSKRNREK